MMRRQRLPIIGILLLLIFFVNFPARADMEDHGSVSHCSGNTVICSVFVNDRQESWDFSKTEDMTRREQILTYLGIACDYLQEQAEAYNWSLDFIYDFDAEDDLAYTCSMDLDHDSDGWESGIWSYIDEHIPTEALLKKYDAENILFLTCMNTDENNTAITCTRSWYPGMPYPYEYISLYFMESGIVNPPAVYAHEILHCFGAPDLYAADEEYGIDDSFVALVGEKLPNDIMYCCSDMDSGDYVYDRITNEISEVTAYYIGWTEMPPSKFFYLLHGAFKDTTAVISSFTHRLETITF